MAQGPPLAETRDRTSKGLNKALPKGRTPAPSSALGARVGAIWFRNAPPSQNFKPVWWKWRECGPTPQHQPQQPTVGPQHSLPDPKPNQTTMKVPQRKGWPEVAPVPFLNSDPVAHFDSSFFLLILKFLWLVKLFYVMGFEFLKLVVSTSSVVWSQVRWFFIFEYFCTINHGERITSFRISSMFYCLNYYPVWYNAIYIYQSCTIV